MWPFLTNQIVFFEYIVNAVHKFIYDIRSKVSGYKWLALPTVADFCSMQWLQLCRDESSYGQQICQPKIGTNKYEQLI